MNWNSVITGESFEKWIQTKLSPDRISQGQRLDPFATSMRDFVAASANLLLVKQGRPLPQRGGAGNQSRTDLASAMLVTGGNDEVLLTDLGESVWQQWQKAGVADDRADHELPRCIIVARCGLAEAIPIYRNMSGFWNEIMVGIPFEDAIRNPDFLYLASFLNSEVEGFNPWAVSRNSGLEIKATTIADIDAVKRRYPQHGALLDKLSTRITDWATRARGRKVFCTAMQLLRLSRSERTYLIDQMSRAPASYIESFDRETVEACFESLDDITLTSIVPTFIKALRNEDVRLAVSDPMVQRLLSSLCAKQFIILTGLAGSGKTKSAQAFARWLSVQGGSYEVVPVGADWTGNENVLGYPNGLEKETYVSKPALDLVIHAKANVDIPHFLILDEMNLSHVERYFADILSVIESEETIRLYDGTERQANGSVIPSSIELPKNVFIIGTVNVDETTYMFSPKVLDRANVIEFRMEADELESFLSNPAKPDLSKLDGKGASFGKAFVDAAKSSVDVPADVKPAYEAEMLLLFKALQAHGAEFGYRTAHEAARFIHFYKLLGNHADGDATWFPKAFDCVVFQKLLPKLHGSRAKLGPLLKVLWFLCVNDAVGRGADALKAAADAARSTDKKAEPLAEVPAGAPYPLSAEKIGRMWRLLRDNGFASFAEA